MIYQAEGLWTPQGAFLRGGWLHVEEDGENKGRITAVGGSEALPADEPVRFLKDCVLVPGLINAHCHLELTAAENQLTPGTAFSEWVQDLQGLTKEYDPADYRSGAQDGVRRLLEGGCTTVLDVGNTGEAIRALAESPLRSFANLEVLGLNPGVAPARFEAALSLAQTMPSTDRFRPGLAPHAAYSASPELLRSVMNHQVSRGLPVSMHACESRDESDLFASATGPLQDFCVRIYPEAPRHVGTSPIRWLDSQGLLPEGILIIHGNYLDAEDIRILARRKASVVHCPSSHGFFGHKPFPYAALRAAGIPVCLGTDSLASGDSLSMLDQMRLFAANHPTVPAEEILAMATTEGARALRMEYENGKLEAGYQADFIAVRLDGIDASPGNLRASALLSPSAQVEQVVIGGIPVRPFT